MQRLTPFIYQKRRFFRVAGNFSELLTEREPPSEIRNEFERHKHTLTGLFIANNVDNRWSVQDSEGNPRYTLIQETTELEVFEHGILHITVEKEGEQVVFGKFHFQGDTDVVKQYILHREVAHLEGSLWIPEELGSARQNLYSLGIFSKVQDAPRETEKIENENDVNGEGSSNPHPTPQTKGCCNNGRKAETEDL